MLDKNQDCNMLLYIVVNSDQVKQFVEDISSTISIWRTSIVAESSMVHQPYYGPIRDSFLKILMARVNSRKHLQIDYKSKC